MGSLKDLLGKSLEKAAASSFTDSTVLPPYKNVSSTFHFVR